MKVKCNRCGYEWNIHTQHLPSRCAKCRSYVWNREPIITWNKGLTKQIDTRIAQYAEKLKGKRPAISGVNHPNFGKHLNEETKQKISQSHFGQHLGARNLFYGKTHTEETRRKLSATWTQKRKEKQAQKFSQLNKGRKPSNYGKYKIRPEQVCSQCNTIFRPRRCKQTYCSHKCVTDSRIGMKLSEETKQKMAANHPDRSGINNGRWLGGISFEPYGIDFNQNLKETIRQRDNYTCQLCFTRQNGRLFNVHHIDYFKINNNPDNLITLCDSCHSKVNSNRNYWQDYLRKLLLERNYASL